MKRINNNWFYSKPYIWMIPAHVYVKGDAIVLIPLFLFILLTGILSIKILISSYLVFTVFRSIGEMIYWLLQQFYNKNYRPYDFGFKSLENNAIYIIYQTISLAWIVIGITLLMIIWFNT